MRTVQTLTTHQIAAALAKAEEGGNVNTPANPARVDAIADRLNTLADERHFNPEELRGDQPAILQDAYLADPVPETLDHDA